MDTGTKTSQTLNSRSSQSRGEDRHLKQEQSPWSLDSDSQSCRLRIRDRFTEVHRAVMSGQDLGSETGTWQVGKARSVGRCEEGNSFHSDEKARARPQRHKDDGNSQRQHSKTDAAHAGFSGSPRVLVKTQIAPPPGSGVPASVGVWCHPRICISLMPPDGVMLLIQGLHFDRAPNPNH